MTIFQNLCNTKIPIFLRTSIPFPCNRPLGNCSIVPYKHGTKYLCAERIFHYTLNRKTGKRYDTYDRKCPGTWFTILDNDFVPLHHNFSSVKLNDELIPNQFYSEDVRLFYWAKKLYIEYSIYSLDRKKCDLRIGELRDSGWKISMKDIFDSSSCLELKNQTHQKNWMAIPDQPGKLIQMVQQDDICIYDIFKRKLNHVKQPMKINIPNVHGNGNILKIEGGYLVLVHNRCGRTYYHYFMVMSSDFVVQKISNRFRFNDSCSIEFAMSMFFALNSNNKTIGVSVCENDAFQYVYLIDKEKLLDFIFNDTQIQSKTIESTTCDEPQLIVSFTSYPHRFQNPEFLSFLRSLTQQKTSVKYKIVMNLFRDDIPKLPRYIKSFADEMNIEILPCNEDIKQHKKYFYVMQKYKNIPVMTVDDDAIYAENMVDDMYKTHLGNPRVVICGKRWVIKHDDFGKVLSYRKWDLVKQTQPLESNQFIFGIGCGGILYPSEVCSQIDDRILKMIYKIKSDDFLMYLISTSIGMTYMTSQASSKYPYIAHGLFGKRPLSYGNDKFAMWKVNSHHDYKTGLEKFMVEHQSLQQLIDDVVGVDVIVSFTSYPHRFLSKDFRLFIDSIVHQNCPKIQFKIVATIWKNDESKITNELREYFQQNHIEIITCDYDWKSHKKYIQCMQKYNNLPVITVDDDQIYDENMLNILYEDHQKNPDVIICGRGRKISFTDDGKAKSYNSWNIINEPNYTSMDVFPTGVGGVLYPPSFCKLITPNTMNEAAKLNCLFNDDLILHYIAVQNNIPTKTVSSKPNRLFTPIKSLSCSEYALYRINTHQHMNDSVVHIFDKSQMVNSI